MLIRMVRMVFQPDKVNEFLQIFNDSKEKIRAFEGCQNVELLQDLTDRNIFMTYSYWKSEAALNNYRRSELFGSVWPATKKLFAAPAHAFSVHKIDDEKLEQLLKK
jgi:quinol monooxygenase YgiN